MLLHTVPSYLSLWQRLQAWIITEAIGDDVLIPAGFVVVSTKKYEVPTRRLPTTHPSQSFGNRSFRSKLLGSYSNFYLKKCESNNYGRIKKVNSKINVIFFWREISYEGAEHSREQERLNKSDFVLENYLVVIINIIFTWSWSSRDRRVLISGLLNIYLTWGCNA